MTRKKSEDAVSPVIGVMLMLVVTVVIAAVVAIFATGMVEETEPAPIAKLDVEILTAYEVNGGTVPTLHLTHVSGDPLDTADLKLSFSWDCEHGDSCPFNTGGHHTSSYQYTGDGKWGTPYDTEEECAFDLKFGTEIAVPSGYAGSTIEPLYINYGLNTGRPHDGAFFGSHVLKRGETMMAYDLHLIMGIKHSGNPAMDVLFNNGEVETSADSGSSVRTAACEWCNDDCTHDPSQYIVYDGEWNGFHCECPTNPTCHENPYHGNFVCPKCGEHAEYSTGWPAGMVCDECGNVDIMPLSSGIMTCLEEGTAVDVIITHTPSNKVIFEKRVFVE